MNHKRSQTVVVLVGILIIFGSALGFVTHLSWKECLRLAAIQIGLTVLYVRYGRVIRNVDDERALYASRVISALVVGFTLTQFDPATSGIDYRIEQERLNPYFILTTLVALCMGVVYIIDRLRSACRSEFGRLEKVVGITVVGVVTVKALSPGFLGKVVSADDLLAIVKVLSILFVWFAVSSVFADQRQTEGVGLLTWGKNNRWKLLFVLVSVLFVVTTLVGAYRIGKVIYHYNSGSRLFGSKDWIQAERQYEIVSRLNAAVDLGFIRDRILGDLAVLNLRQGDENAARGYLVALRESTYNEADAHVKIGDNYLKTNRWVQAANAFKASLDLTGKDAAIIDRLGSAYLKLRDSRGFMETIERFRYFPSVLPETSDEYVFLGDIKLQRGNSSQALLSYQSAAALSPENTYIEYKIGRALFSNNELEESIRKFEIVVSRSPKFADAYFRIGRCYEAQGRIAEAVEMYKKTVQILPDHLDSWLALERTIDRTP